MTGRLYVAEHTRPPAGVAAALYCHRVRYVTAAPSPQLAARTLSVVCPSIDVRGVRVVSLAFDWDVVAARAAQALDARGLVYVFPDIVHPGVAHRVLRVTRRTLQVIGTIDSERRFTAL